MSKEELNSIQFKLKAAIQRHQAVVARLKADQKNAALQGELRGIQREITALGDQQKHVIAQLRRNLTATKVKREEKEKVDSPPAEKEARLEPASHPPKPEPTSHPPKHHTPRPSILQGRRSVLRLQSDVPMKSPPEPREASADIRRLLQFGIAGQALTPQQIQKLEYMASLNLVTRARLKELESRRGERRRRSTANPLYSHPHVSAEERTRTFMDEGPIRARKRGRPPAAEKLAAMRMRTPTPPPPLQPAEPLVCTVCERGEDLAVCQACSKAYHMTCLHGPVAGVTAQRHPWTCPVCSSATQMSLRASIAECHSPTEERLGACVAAREAEKEEERSGLETRGQLLRDTGKQLQHAALALGNLVQQKVNERQDLHKAYEAADDRVQRLQDLVQHIKQS